MSTNEEVPLLGLGTYRITDHDQCKDTIRTALEVGYRCIDTAEAYQNEEAVGEGIVDTNDVARDDVYLATKVLHPKFADGYAAEDIVDAAYSCLERLNVERVELLYGVHWPGAEYDPEETFAACAQLSDDGVMDRLGVCNMTPELMDEARSVSDIRITALQVEMHPLLQQRDLREYCGRHDITLIGYAPFGNGRIFDVPEIREIAERHGVSTAQVTLVWFRHKGVPTIPKAISKDHLRDNWRSRKLELNDEDIEEIDAISREERQYNPDYAPDW